MLSLLAYNLIRWLQTLYFLEGQQNIQIETIRTRRIKVVNKIIILGFILLVYIQVEITPAKIKSIRIIDIYFFFIMN